jgi:hypothetical protein
VRISTTRGCCECHKECTQRILGILEFAVEVKIIREREFKEFEGRVKSDSFIEINPRKIDAKYFGLKSLQKLKRTVEVLRSRIVNSLWVIRSNGSV